MSEEFKPVEGALRPEERFATEDDHAAAEKRRDEAIAARDEARATARAVARGTPPDEAEKEARSELKEEKKAAKAADKA